MPDFLPGLQLNNLFYHQAVRPILQTHFPGLAHSAARLGAGSEVLGYDDEMSTDHDWGPRLQLFLTEADWEAQATAVSDTLSHNLPAAFQGYPVHFGPPDEEGTRLLIENHVGPVAHRIEVTTIRQFFQNYMALDPFADLSAADWLTTPQQLLLGATAGQVYADGLGQLTAVRHHLAYYPHDIWLYLLASQWARIGQEEHFVGRTAMRNDELGSRLLAARLVHDLMQLCFLMEKRYAPYPKWFGTAFMELDSATKMEPLLQHILTAVHPKDREERLCTAYELAARLHNQLHITEPLDTAVSPFHNRPFCVIHAERFVQAIKNAMTDPAAQAIWHDIGSIDQFSDNTDLRETRRLYRRLATLYHPLEEP
ncbi:MAG: DUF4037 domain-containing protein [Ardenticatenaceae bacterium]|nr:DUF4037 domain-containing protein [Anaerolineales bacterium]MCB8920148.1 DUF4037 domain-containing protein [Ardenticatenaceae bacterium]MCB9005057.1 DUF4037 domain-containing protein [Ardenticatenaceae bacterium]